MTDDAPTAVPPYGLPGSNRRVLLARRPRGVPQPADFALDEGAVPEPADGQFLLRNIFLSVDPAQRGWASEEANYSEPVPLGGVMRGLATGIVLRSRDPGVREGEFLYGMFGWQDYAVADTSRVLMRLRSPIPLRTAANLHGINGLTAFLALTELGRPRQGETLLVSTAAGGVGSFVGQIGRILGCRTIGLTGSGSKVERCRDRYGYEAAFDYRTSELDPALRSAVPEGIDVYFDNTGGTILDTALRQMRRGGRIVQCGTAATASWTPQPTGPRNEREILTRRLVWSGFVVFDWADRYEAAAAQLAAWYRAGLIVSDEDVSDGIGAAPGALAEIYAGRNHGKKLVYVG